jgi:hypothetical protein
LLTTAMSGASRTPLSETPYSGSQPGYERPVYGGDDEVAGVIG